MRQRLLRARAGTLRFTPREARLYGPPTNATVTVRRADGAELAPAVEAAEAAVDAFQGVVQSRVEAGSRRVPLDTVAGISPGRRYLIDLGNGERILVTAIGVDDDDLVLAHPLPCRLESNVLPAELPVGFDAPATVLGVEISFDLTAEQTTVATSGAPDSTLFLATWSYSCGGAQTETESFRILPRIVSSRAEAEDLQPYLPTRADKLLRSGDSPSFAGVLEAAWQEVLDDVENAGIRPDRIVDAHRLFRPQLLKACVLLGSGWPGYEDWTTRKENEYQAALAGVLAAPGWVDQDDDAKQDAAEESWAPSIRLTR